MKVRYSYLPQQFSDPTEILENLRALVASGDFTLGKVVAEFERKFADLIGTRHAIGVGSGTDALKLGLKAAGVGYGDEVITAANTFIATVGAINEIGARPVFVDCDDSFCIDVDKVEAAITSRTRAIMPVHLTGEVSDMPRLMEISKRRDIPIVEDACQAILGEVAGKRCGTWGVAAGFSLHPLKNLNVWGDAGVVVTNDDAIAEKLRLIRNHGLKNRDEITVLGYNSRLDSVQAVVGNWIIGQTHEITRRRIENAQFYDSAFAGMNGIRVPPRKPQTRRVFHLYMVFAEQRNALLAYCLERGVEAKVHYPIPLYAQEGLRMFGYPLGTFPVTDRHAQDIISFPADQHLTRDQQEFVVETVREFYVKG